MFVTGISGCQPDLAKRAASLQSLAGFTRQATCRPGSQVHYGESLPEGD